ncbi:YcaO-like family protein [Paenibacillus konkukensis]|uniref:YcaO-like family protein n=1 Tax=Paenibacillus konkukensis TaxID=2020716 RepID=A0ABY4RSW2_9BACL|nr:TOMM precursor leader peptide-binding protein [Paenibacillus konkukensis]UQZ85130.1 YcaO-like family protein [Paenibacillus konkukensis]
MSALVVIVGEGQLADLVAGDLARSFRVVRRQSISGGMAGADLALTLHDGWQPGIHLRAEEELPPAGIPWLRACVLFGEGLVGPLVKPGAPGCSQCADARLHMAGQDRPSMWRLRRKLAEEGGTERDAWDARGGMLQLALLTAAQSRKALERPDEADSGLMHIVNMHTLAISRHRVLPDAHCPVCSRIRDDTEAAARITLQPNPKERPDSYRIRSMEELRDALAADYLDSRTGLLNAAVTDLVSPFADASVNLPLMNEDVGAAGRTHSYEASRLTAMLEGLERYSSIRPRGKRTSVYGSYQELREQALDPVKTGVHSAEQYALPGYPFRPFDPEAPLRWVWGYSFLQERPILVPESLAYYGSGGGQSFVFESSNGCALGGSLEEAVLHGILEVAERDAFLMTWYARLPLPRLDLSTAGDAELNLMLARLEAVADFDVRFYNATMEYGIPSVWGIAVNRKRQGLRLLCGAGAHPDPVRAVKGAVHELAAMALNLGPKLAGDLERYEAMLRDSSLVARMEDHSLLYGLPEAQERLGFLLDDSRPARSFAAEFPAKKIYADLTDELRALLRSLGRRQLDVIAVDVTAPEIARNGLFCVKVLIPGLIPMTFGHSFTRLTGLERLLTVPAELGYADRPLTPDQLNEFPHPFP